MLASVSSPKSGFYNEMEPKVVRVGNFSDLIVIRMKQMQRGRHFPTVFWDFIGIPGLQVQQDETGITQMGLSSRPACCVNSYATRGIAILYVLYKVS